MPNQAPSVLAVVVVRDGAPWLQRTLASLARQTHPRLGVLAVDCGSDDGSADVLEGVLGSRRLIRLDENVGFAAAVQRALSIPAAAQADFVLLLHDDTVLAPEAVARMVEAAGRVPGTGVVGPKVLDWRSPEVLLEVGFASDRFGHRYSPLEEGELDQGQYDATREVLFVSSTAMLVSREAWTRAGLHDERLATGAADLDFGWRVRLAGFRVVVTPGAVALHRLAGERGERTGGPPGGGRSPGDRAGLASLLKNYGPLTLLWVLPLYAVQGLARVLLHLATRNFARAAQVVRAWGWNLGHLPGTIRRRVRAQAVRRVRDREITRFMAPPGSRLRRRALQASSLLVGRRTGAAEADEEPEAPPLRHRLGSLIAQHPVAVGWILAAVLTLIAFRGILFVPRIEGGALPVFPHGPADLLREFAADWRSTGFGGDGIASPALVPLAIGSAVTLGDPNLLARLLVALAPILAAVSSYRVLTRLGFTRAAGVLAAACYALSAMTLWAVSGGRIPTIALLIAVPPVTVRAWEAFGGRGPAQPFRWVVGTGMVLALAGTFFPAVWLAAGLALVPALLVPDRVAAVPRGLGLLLGAAAVAAALVFPFTLELADAGGGAAVGSAGAPDFLSLLRLSPGSAPGSWAVASFLPLAGIVAFALVEEPHRRWAWRAVLTAAAGIPLAWLAAAGHLPGAVASPMAFLGPSGFALCLLVAMAAHSLVPGMRRTAFGSRQLAVGALVTLLGLGLGLQSVQALGEGWAVGEGRVSPAWPVVATDEPGVPFRVLWLGRPLADALPPPGGEPEGVVAASDASVSYGVTGRGGRSVLALAMPATDPGHERLRVALASVLTGRVRHGGALLAPMGIRYVVAGDRDLPPAAAARLAAQVDLDLVQRTAGLRIYRNARALPEAVALPGEAAVAAARSPELLAARRLDPGSGSALRGGPGPSWQGAVPDRGRALVLVSTGFDPRWRLRTARGSGEPFTAFGWAVGFEPTAGAVEVTFDGRFRRNLELASLALLWLAALWAVRRRASDREGAGPEGAPSSETPPRRVPVPQGSDR